MGYKQTLHYTCHNQLYLNMSSSYGICFWLDHFGICNLHNCLNDQISSIKQKETPPLHVLLFKSQGSGHSYLSHPLIISKTIGTMY